VNPGTSGLSATPLSGNLTIVLFVCNEEQRIDLALRNFQGLFPILVVDNCSTDRSVAMAREAGAEVLTLLNPGFVECDEVMGPVQAAIRTDFLFMAFAGEHYPRALLERLAAIAQAGEADIVRTYRYSITAGEAIPISSSMESGYQGEMRLFRRGSISFTGNRVHGKGTPMVAADRICEIGPDPDLAILQFRDHDAAHTERQNNRYNEVWARQRFADGERFGLVRSLVMPLAYVANTWLRHGAWRWGIAGFHQAAMRGIMEFQVHLRLWELERGLQQPAVISRNRAQREALLGDGAPNGLTPDLNRLRAAAEFPTWALMALLMAILGHGLCGRTFPEGFGCSEALVGGLLVISIAGAWTTRWRLRHLLAGLGWRWLLALALTLATIAGATGCGLLRDQGGRQFMRDLLPALFLLLPLATLPLLQRQPERVFSLLAVVMELAGAALALRSLAAVHFDYALAKAWQTGPGFGGISCDPFIMAAAGLALAGLCFPRANHRWDRISASLLHAVCLAPCCAVFIVFTQRAPLALLGALFAAFAIITFWEYRQPPVETAHLQGGKRLLIVGGLCLALALTLNAVFSDRGQPSILADIRNEQQHYGGNLKALELQALRAVIGESPSSVTFGHGFGSTFANPALAGQEVGYTHSFLTYLLFKFGVVGTALLTAAGGLVMWSLLPRRLLHPFVLACGAALSIGVLTQATHKSLPFFLLAGLALAYLRLTDHRIALAERS